MNETVPSSQATSGPDRKLALLVLIAFVYLLANCLYYWPYLVDDAFISLRYSRNLVEGHGLVYNVGERVEGFSNFTWVLLGSGLLGAGLPPILGLKLVGMAAAIGTALCTWALGLRWFAGQAYGRATAALATLLLCTHNALAVWSQGGLETTLFVFLIVASLLRFDLELESPRRPWSALLFGLAWMTRPEAPIYALAFVAARFARGPRALKADLVWIGTFTAVVLPYEIFGLVYYGSLFPTTHAAKVGDEGIRLFRAISAGRFGNTLVGEFTLQHGIGGALLLAPALLGAALARSRRTLAAWAMVLGGLFFAAYAHTDWMPWFRLQVPMLPFLALIVAGGWAALAERATGSKRWACLALLLVGFGWHFKRQSFDGWPGGWGNFVNEERGAWWTEIPSQLGRSEYSQEPETWFLIENIAPDSPIVVAAIGLPGWLCDVPVFDPRGLVTPSAAAARHDHEGGSNGAMLDELWELEPGCMILPKAGEGPKSVIARFDRAVREDPRFAQAYERRQDLLTARIVYLRRDRSPFDKRAAIEAALARFPEYRSEYEDRAREWLEKP